MKRYKYLLLEKDLSVNEALTIFGIKDIPNQSDLQTLYRTLSKTHHPDKGGKIETMQQINQAYEVLKKMSPAHGGSVTPTRSWTEINKEWEEKNKRNFPVMKKIFEDAFDEHNLVKYLQQFVQDELFIEVEQTDPHKINQRAWESSMLSFRAEVKIHNKDNTVVFYVRYIIDANYRTSGGLGYDGQDEKDILFNVMINSDIYYNNRKNKLGQSDYKWDVGHKTIEDFKKVFPEATLKKIFSGKGKQSFKRADMFLGIQREIGPMTIETDGFFLYPFGKDEKFYFWVSRSTLNRQAYYMINNFSFISPATKKYDSKNRLDHLTSFYETAEDLRKLVDCVNEVKKLVKQHGYDIVEDSVKIFELFKMSFKHYFPKRY